MADTPTTTEQENRFDLQLMLKELEAEAAQEARGRVDQTDIAKMFKSRKPRDNAGQ